MNNFDSCSLNSVSTIKSSLNRKSTIMLNSSETESTLKWKGVMIESLWKIASQMNPEAYNIEQAAMDDVESLLMHLLLKLTVTKPITVSDVQNFVLKTFPKPINTWAVEKMDKDLCQQVPGGSTVSAKFTKRISKEKRAFAQHKIQNFLKEIFGYKPEVQTALAVVSLLEYVASDVLKLVFNYVRNIRHNRISQQDLRVALSADTVLMELFFCNDEEASNVLNSNDISYLTSVEAQKQLDQCTSYLQAVKDLIHEETQYLRDLNLIVLVFKRAFEDALTQDGTKSDLEVRETVDKIFNNIADVRDFTTNFLSLLEDTLEMRRDESQPLVGACFVEMAQTYEFFVYRTYIEEVMKPECLEYLDYILDTDKNLRDYLEAVQFGFILAVKYLLPKLLLIPVRHCAKYFEYISLFHKLTQSEDDEKDLFDAESALIILKTRLELCSASLKRKLIGKFQTRFTSGGRNLIALAKLNELKKLIEGFSSKAECKMASEFVTDGSLGKYNQFGNAVLGATDTLRSKTTRITERHVFLFDTMMVLCKPLTPAQIKRAKETQISSTVTGTGSQHGLNQSIINSPECYRYKFKEFFITRRSEIVDVKDSEELKNAFEIRLKDDTFSTSSVLLFTKNEEEKRDWMACLVLVQSRCMLERMLDSSLQDEENSIPLILPSVDQYRFAEKDSEDNIIFEDYLSSSGLPIVKGATLQKLIERLTPNQLSDPTFSKMFLMTYRAFCDQSELLSLLIERFSIPDLFPASILSNNMNFPNNNYNISSIDFVDTPFCTTPGFEDDISLMSSSLYCDDQNLRLKDIDKKFRKKYAQPVQIRVLNVIRHWVDDHWYDFNQDEKLLNDLKQFLESIENAKFKHLKKWAKNIREIIARKEKLAPTGEVPKEFNLPAKPPPVEYHVTKTSEEFDILTLHPLEVARQMTLLEFELYRAVRPFELVDASFTKKDKSRRSPQLTKLIQHSTQFTYWLEKCIVETGNLEERVIVVNRILEIMCGFEELNNFNGLIEIYGAMFSAAVDRLTFTLERLDRNLLKRFNEVKQLYADPRHRSVRLKLKNINPPCVPYFGTYLTSLTYLNENKTFLQHTSVAPLSDTTTLDSFDVNGLLSAEKSPTGQEDYPNPQLINVAKCRKIYEIIGEIQLYQDQPYCLQAEPSIRNFFESLNPLHEFNNNANELESYLYDRSLIIEPKNVDKPPHFNMSRDPAIVRQPVAKPAKKTKQNSTTPPFLFTPLGKFSKDKASTSGINTFSPPSGSTPSPTSNIAVPPSPSSSKDANFSLIDIHPGKPPRYIRDLPANTSAVLEQAALSTTSSAYNGRTGRASSNPIPSPTENQHPLANGGPVATSTPRTPPAMVAPVRPLHPKGGAAAQAPALPPRTHQHPARPSGAPGPNCSPVRFQFPDLSAAPPVIPPRRPPSCCTSTDPAGLLDASAINRSVTSSTISSTLSESLESPLTLTATDAPPALPPRRSSHQHAATGAADQSPPPRPPKTFTRLNESAPMLPPKTYKSRTNVQH